MATEREDARADLEYANGFSAGWNAGFQAGMEAELRHADFQRRDDGLPSWVSALWRSIEVRREAARAVLKNS